MASSGTISPPSLQVDSSLRNIITYIVNKANLGNDKTRNEWDEKHKPDGWPSNICYENPNDSLTTPKKWAMLFAGMSCIYKRNIHKNLKPHERSLLRLQLMALENCNTRIMKTCEKLRKLLQMLNENMSDILEQDWSRGIITEKLKEHEFYPRKQGDDSNASDPLPKLDIEQECKINGRRPVFLAKIKSFSSMDKLDAESAMKIANECMELEWTRKRRSKQSTKIVERDFELSCNKTVLSSKRRKTANLPSETLYISNGSQAVLDSQTSKSSTASQVSSSSQVTSPSQETAPSQVTSPSQVTAPSQVTSPSQVTALSQVTSPSQKTSPSQVSLNSLQEQTFQTPFVSQQSHIYQTSEKEKSVQPSHVLMGSIQLQGRHSVIETLQMEKVQDNIQHNPALQIQDIQNSNQDIWKPNTQPKSVDKQICTSSNHQIPTDHVQTPSSKMTAKYPYIRKLLNQTTDTKTNSLVPQTVAVSGDNLPKQVQQTDSTESRHTDLNTVQPTGTTESRPTDLNTDGMSLIPVSQANVRSQSFQVTGRHSEIDSNPDMNLFGNLFDMDYFSFGNLDDFENFN